MARMSNLVQVFNVQCVMCGRVAGQLLNGTFVPGEHATLPVAGRTGSRCGECGGNLYLEPDEAITPFMAAQLAARRTSSESALRAA